MKIKFYYVIDGTNILYGPASRKSCERYLGKLQTSRYLVPPTMQIFFEEKELTLFED